MIPCFATSDWVAAHRDLVKRFNHPLYDAGPEASGEVSLPKRAPGFLNSA